MIKLYRGGVFKEIFLVFLFLLVEVFFWNLVFVY